ncbi:hypothetical protein GCM10029976_039830 [Kribbella albertanoniae]|uniref:DUF1851 domain-containing protein n=1 Tax=Kribbella albertanoniae TaxID=1266829 RepID=A0A4R4Q996_9ACTN|nr:T6SS immunity protein Tdi1 domain-containing protein [Kribbella albertanoniae]TDC31837.1 DUF1851 domain-containing protein [Kribbella albertanoniae]
MLLDRFRNDFDLTDGQVSDAAEFVGLTPLQEVRARFGGCTFRDGLYRIHGESSAAVAKAWVDDAFPEFKGRFEIFGFDWLGRQFAADRARGEASDPEVMLIEPGAGEALEIPVPFSKFHDEELVDYSDEALAVNFYAQWRSQSPGSLGFDQCAGYQVPLFLGGKDQVENLELSDIEVYWGIMGQLRAQAREVGLGNPIAGIDLS